MESYIGTKIIKAEPMNDLDFEIEKSMFESAKETMKSYKSGKNLLVRNQRSEVAMQELREPKEGYKIMYPDGYTSWSPKVVFENAYRLISDSEISLIV